MKRKTLGIVLALSAVFIMLATDVAPAWAQTIVWTKQWGTWNNDYVWGTAVYGSAFYITGYVYAALPGQTAKGGADVYVRKYDLNGNLLWTRQFGTAKNDRGLAISADASGIYVCGDTWGAMPGQSWQGGGSGDGFVCKFDSYGNLKWTRQFGSNGYDAGYGVAVYGGGVYVVGPGFLYSYPGHVLGPFMVIKFDVYGNVKWISTFGSFSSIDTTKSAPRAVSVYGSSVLITGYQTWTSLPGKPDAFVYKFDTYGKYKWSRNIATSGADEAYGVAVSTVGDVFVTGRTTGALPGQTNKGGYDAFVRKYDAYGNVKWTRQFGTSKIDSAYAVAIYGSGIYVGGETTGSLARQNTMGYVDPFLRKYDIYGTLKWTKQYGASYPDEGIKTVAAASSGVYAAGIIRYGAFPGYTNKGGYDVFISKFGL